MSKKQMEIILDQIQQDFEERLSQRRKLLLDIFEGIFDHTEHWPTIRQKLLKFLGDSGLRGDLVEVMSQARLAVRDEAE